ncbi:MAG: hypothetical protein VXY73_06155 [Pseudomonadota bacterium]|jgi:hypothetical protein|nr:hypothetical protein [Pseudomonadota bacterium]
MPDYDYDAYCKKLARKAGASDEIRGPKLTLNLAKAAVIVLPKEGRKLTPQDKEFETWKRKLS